MNSWDLIPVLLLLLLALALGAGAAMLALAVRWRRRKAQAEGKTMSPPEIEMAFPPPAPQAVWRRPGCWLAIRSRSLAAVQEALELNNAKPCSWSEGLSGEGQLFISPPVNGWVFVVGAGLPDPGEDVDVCFRFLVELSRRVGQVQFF